MRRLDLLLDHVNRTTESTNESTPPRISELEKVQFFNEAQQVLQSKIVATHPRMFYSQSYISIVQNQEDYTPPEDMFCGTHIVSLEFLFGSAPGQYRKLRNETTHSRNTIFTSNIPIFYIREYKNLKLNPIPSQSLTNGLRVTYVRQLRTLDVRRGQISSASKTSTTLNSITISLSPTLGKDDQTPTQAADLLNRADYICVVDKSGASLVDNIPIDSYNSTTGVLTVSTGFTTSVAASAFVGAYITAGRYSTTHSELPDNCERFLINYAAHKCYRRSGNDFEAQMQKSELNDMEKDILDSFGQPDSDIHDILEGWDWHGQ